MTRLADSFRRLVFCLLRRRVVTASLVAVAFCLSPFAVSAGAHLAHSHSHGHAAAAHDHSPAEDGHIDFDPGVQHCGSHACAPSFVVACPSDHALHDPSARLQGLTAEGSLLRPLYLGGDPPVPRRGFSAF